MGLSTEPEIDRLPVDLLSHIFVLISSFTDLAQASSVCSKWRKGVKQSLARRERLSFSGWKMDDDSTARLVRHAYSLKELDISRSRWSCQITDDGLYKISLAKCVSNLTSISLWGMTGVTDNGVVQLVSRAISLQHLNIGGTFITDESLFAIANNCPHLKTIVLWSCRHVTENGLVMLVSKCRKLESINVWEFLSFLSFSANTWIRVLRAEERIEATMAAVDSVQCFGRKKTAVAVTYCKRGRGLIKINGCPIELVEPEILRYKAYEPILLLGRQRFAGVDMRIRVRGGGHTSQIYAIRQSIAKALVAYYQKYVDEQSKKEIKDILVRYDRTLLVADPRRCEPKKFGGRGARARFQKSYR
ncbi:hypothetical protein HHK36_030951 [Tetracentron sinense]|uniref:F-box domain-containing protein n=1 Tax=Tetracentron sinense TaxID=13715 RepID=A0A834YAF7_TETSI|nr:hypothetical protein HHK36_030951 [Tetracentron sinense]